MTITKMTNYQALLNVIPPNVSDKDLEEIKKFLIKYFAEKAIESADRFWNEKGFKSDDDMEKYLNEK